MSRKRAGIEEKILEWVESGPVAAVELTLRLANARFKKRIAPANGGTIRTRKSARRTEPIAENASA
jgi:hypothetical protein